MRLLALLAAFAAGFVAGALSVRGLPHDDDSIGLPNVESANDDWGGW